MRIAIVEDEIIWQETIEKILLEYYHGNVNLKRYDSGEEFLETDEEYDLVFMDVELKGKDGFTISKEYKKQNPNGILIILTTHNESWNKGYQVEAFRYIHKLKIEEIQEALDSASKKITRNQEITLHAILNQEITVAYKDILYFETSGHNVLMHTRDDVFQCKENITLLAKQLEDKGFYYIHRSFLINMDYVKSYNQNEVIMYGEDAVLVSRRKYKDFKTQFMIWNFERGNG